MTRARAEIPTERQRLAEPLMKTSRNRRQTPAGHLYLGIAALAFGPCGAQGAMAGTSLTATPIAIEARALSGTDGPLGPGLGPGVRFESMMVPLVDDDGRVAFRASLSSGTGGVTTANRAGIWSEGGGMGLRLVARQGSPAPGTGNANFSLFNPIVFNRAGQLAFRAQLDTGSTSNDRGIWLESGTTLALVARAGGSAPGAGPGVTFRDFLQPLLSDAGRVITTATLTRGGSVTETNDSGLWMQGGAGTLEMLARAGDPAPGAGTGARFAAFGDPTFLRPGPAINQLGQVAFAAGLVGSGVTVANDRGVWSQSGAIGPVLIARRGDPAPGAGGSTFNLLSNVAINDAGTTAFVADLSGPGIDDTNRFGLWTHRATLGTQLRLRTGTQAAGTPPGTHFAQFGSLAMGGGNQPAISALIVGPGVTSSNHRGIWILGSESGATLVARTGSPAPGTGPGVVYSDSFVLLLPLFSPVVNALGQVAFMGEVAGPGVDLTNNLGLWATDPSGTLRLLVRTGDQIDVGRGTVTPDARTVESISLAFSQGSQSGEGSSFSDAGVLAFGLSFTDGSSGVFIATVAAGSETIFASGFE